MSSSPRLRVLSLNSYIMGHATYHDMLEKTFSEHIPEVDFRGVKLNGYPLSFSSRALYKLLTLPLPILSDLNWDFMRLRLELGSSLLARKCLDQQLRINTPDVLHIHTQAISFLSLDIFERIPTVINIDFTTALLSKVHAAPAQTTYQPIIALEQECFNRAAHILTWNEQARTSVIQDYGIQPSKVSTVHPSVPLDLFLNLKREPRQAGDKVRLLFVGNDFERKGGEDLLAIFQEHLSAECELDIATNSPLSIQPRENLRIHRGLQPLSLDLLNLYRAADIFVLPSHEDVFPMVFIESMAAGLPSIATKVLAVPELVRDGLNGILIEPGNKIALAKALQTLIADENLRVTMGNNGRALAKEEFDNVKNCRRIYDIFRGCSA